MVRGRKTEMVIEVTLEDRGILESWQRSTTIRAGLARRGRIILLLAGGESISQAARIVGIRRRFVYKWARRYVDQGIAGLADKPGRGRGGHSAAGHNHASREEPNDAEDSPLQADTLPGGAADRLPAPRQTPDGAAGSSGSLVGRHPEQAPGEKVRRLDYQRLTGLVWALGPVKQPLRGPRRLIHRRFVDPS